MRYLFESPKKTKERKPENMASSITAKVLEIRKESIKNCMGDFTTLSHRQHYIDTIDGGNGHNNYSELIETAKQKVKAIVSLGTEKENIEMTFRGVVNEIYEASDIVEAVRVASIIAEENDMVLFSPACKDQESDYEVRGNVFIDEVRKLGE